MPKDALSAEFKTLYDQWEQAIHEKDWAWFECNFAADWVGTARPWPEVNLNRDQLIEVDKQIEAMDAQWIEVMAHRLGDVVVTVAVSRIGYEEFKPGGDLAPGATSLKEFNDYCAGNTISYAGAWRHNGERWQMFDHRLIGIIHGFEQ